MFTKYVKRETGNGKWEMGNGKLETEAGTGTVTGP